jgi:CRISPR-associated protein Cmr3
MNTWIIEPRDPLIVRDGRPFGPTPGARAASLTFPFPSTTTGAVRTRDGLDADGCFQPSQIPRVKQIAVRGPLLVELDSTTGDIAQWLAPAPADALLLDVEPPDPAKAVLKRLVPLQLPPQASTNLPGGLSLVGMPKPDPRKPCGKTPRYWNWDQFEKWLLNPQEREVALGDLGHNGPVSEERMHVSIDPVKQTAAEGMLFQTRGLEFTWTKGKKLTQAVRLALAVATNAPNLKAGIAPLGGERRLVSWRRSSRPLPSCPDALRVDIVQHRHCRVVLLTPAHFLNGSQPSWLVSQREGVTPSLQAIAIGRPQVVSGWDFENNRPKPTRRLAPAGTTLFLKLDGDDTAIERWIDATWMHCVSDEEQDRLDGFGLAVLGVWDGNLQPMEV